MIYEKQLTTMLALGLLTPEEYDSLADVRTKAEMSTRLLNMKIWQSTACWKAFDALFDRIPELCTRHLDEMTKTLPHGVQLAMELYHRGEVTALEVNRALQFLNTDTPDYAEAGLCFPYRSDRGGMMRTAFKVLLRHMGYTPVVTEDEDEDFTGVGC